MNSKISVFIVTLNEAQHIARAVESVASLDEVIVVDSGSTDGTIDIATQAGARVIHQDWLGFAAQKSFAMSQCRNEWCINLDGDEALPPEMLEEIQQLIDQDQCDLIRFPIEDIFMGDKMHPSSRKRSIVRAFKKSMVRYPMDKQVHENIESDGREMKTKHRMLHWGYDDLATFMEKNSKYARLSAEDKFKRGKRASVFKLITVFPATFLKVYLLRKLCLSGTRGLVQAYVEAMYAFLKEANLYQLQRR